MEYSIQSTTSVGRKSQKAALKLSTDERHPNLHGWIVVCIENLIRFDRVAESHSVGANGRADILLAERGCLALQVEDPA